MWWFDWSLLWWTMNNSSLNKNMYEKGVHSWLINPTSLLSLKKKSILGRSLESSVCCVQISSWNATTSNSKSHIWLLVFLINWWKKKRLLYCWNLGLAIIQTDLQIYCYFFRNWSYSPHFYFTQFCMDPYLAFITTVKEQVKVNGKQCCSLLFLT